MRCFRISVRKDGNGRAFNQLVFTFNPLWGERKGDEAKDTTGHRSPKSSKTP